jgi:hypothetical protein
VRSRTLGRLTPEEEVAELEFEVASLHLRLGEAQGALRQAKLDLAAS